MPCSASGMPESHLGIVDVVIRHRECRIVTLAMPDCFRHWECRKPASGMPEAGIVNAGSRHRQCREFRHRQCRKRTLGTREYSWYCIQKQYPIVLYYLSINQLSLQGSDLGPNCFFFRFLFAILCNQHALDNHVTWWMHHLWQVDQPSD